MGEVKRDGYSVLIRQLAGFKGQLRDVVGGGVHYRFDLNKQEYRLRVPKEEETEDRLVVYIEPNDEFTVETWPDSNRPAPLKIDKFARRA